LENFTVMKKALRIISVSLLIGLMLAGCSQENTADGQSENLIAETIEHSAVVPTETLSPPVMLLLAGPESDPVTLANAQVQVEQIALQQGMGFETRQALTLETAPENLKVVVALPPVDNLADLAASLPLSKFVGLNIPGLSSGGNLIAIGGNQPSEFQAFMAGYIAAVQSDDWRVGLIYFGDEGGRNYKNAFLSGALYFCGLCNPYYPPFNEYPLYSEVSVGASPEILQQAADNLISQGVNTVHLAPGVETDNLYSYMAGNNLRFVGTGAPPAGIEGYWIASVLSTGGIDLSQVIIGALNGQSDFDSISAIEITYTGLSEARLTHYREILARLESGEIDPLGSDIE
jgi:predicted small secreted protein